MKYHQLNLKFLHRYIKLEIKVEVPKPDFMLLIYRSQQSIRILDVALRPLYTAYKSFFLSAAYKCITDQREHLEETLPLILGLILGLIIIITLTIYHFHLKLTANQPQLPRDRSMYKNM